MVPNKSYTAVQVTRDGLQNALEAVKCGMTVHTASKTFKVPKTTLYNHYIKNLSADIKQGAPSILSKDQERYLCTWIDHMAKIGFPISKEMLLDSVQLIVKNLKISNNFRGGRPGRHWYNGFLKRNPSISKRVSQYLTKNRAQVNEAKIRSWFKEITLYLETNGYLPIFDHAERIFNCDETAFFLSPKESSVLVKKGQKSVYSFVANDEKENVTTLVMGNAKGTLGPPMVVFPYKRIPLNIAKSMPDSWGIGRSDSGWMTGELFFEYIANIFYPWLVREQIQFPVVLFVDGHTSHMTLTLSEFCNTKEIILISLLPNATSILQPMDVAYFHPLKLSWKNAVKNWRMEHNGSRIRREDFGPLLSSILGNVRFQENLRNGFNACGLYPLNANAINYEKFISNELKPFIQNDRQNNGQQSNIDLNILSDHLEHLDCYLGHLKLNLFEMALLCNSWTGSKEDTSLYEYWKNLKNKIAAINNSAPKRDCVGEPSYLNIGDTLDNSLLGIDDMDVDLDGILGENSALTLNVEFDGSVTVENELTPKKLDQRLNTDLPTPFKQNLIWPTPKLESMSCRREKLPAVISSQQWILYSKNKIEKKEKENTEKEERKRQRQEKIAKKRNHCTDSGKKEKNETVTSATATDVDLELKVQQYVIVKYEGELFPGIIQNVKNDEYYVRVMCMSGNHWKWPDKDDECWYSKLDIIQKIVEPVLINARGVYTVQEVNLLRHINN